MKKMVLIITVLSIGTLFNFTTKAYASYHHYESQDATAYTGSTYGHGATYGYLNQKYSTVAVHKHSNNSPYIPFGTVITTDSKVYLNGFGFRSTFTVTDTGPGYNRTSYWIDIYYGSDEVFANQFGVKTVSYHANY